MNTEEYIHSLIKRDIAEKYISALISYAQHEMTYRPALSIWIEANKGINDLISSQHKHATNSMTVKGAFANYVQAVQLDCINDIYKKIEVLLKNGMLFKSRTAKDKAIRSLRDFLKEYIIK